MVFDKLYTIAFIRWTHIIMGVMWIGFFIFMHLIVRPYLATLDGEGKAKAYRALIWRGLKWCRGTSMAAFLLGIGVLGHLWVQNVYFTEGVGLVGRGKFIMWAMTLAVAMWANLWFLISPAQKKIVAAFDSGIGASDADLAKVNKLGTINVYLAGPMLYLMVFANNFPAFHYGHMGLGIVIGLLMMQIVVSLANKGNK